VAKETLKTSSNPHPLTPFLVDAQAAESPNWLIAVRAAESKKAKDLVVLDFRGVTSFTDFFVICTSTSQRQAQAIADEIGQKLKKIGEVPVSVEGYDAAEWLLLDYGDFVVHIFSESARAYYQLERLWRQAKTLDIAGQR
jgi:ribosome-associated protein